MLTDVPYNKYAKEVLEQLGSGGAFLTTLGEKPNTMTIGWGFIGRMWERPVFVVPVRHSRYTHELIEKNGEFTVSIPFGSLKKELAFCGGKSGRDVNKFKQMNLTPLKSKHLNTPVIEECDLHYECKVVFRQEMDGNMLYGEYDRKWYESKDYHTLYYGEILACYVKK